MGELITGILGNYSQFFSFDVFWSVVSNPVNWAIIGSLIVLEGLLSADNALVLAIMVKHLPPKQQKKALFYGILGAYLFRFVAIGIGTYLIKIWWVKAIGALYLLWMAAQFFFFSGRGKEKEGVNMEEKTASMGFWRTVLAVEIMDIAFSMDSVLAAFGVSDQVWVLYMGGILGIAMMRGVAQIFLILIDRYPELETTAYILIALIGGKMMLSAFNIHIGNLPFFGVMVLIFLSTFVIHHSQAGKA
ncbi:MAG: alx [Firmicutes bacterium]|nr:alx [Bacillota bacterium]